MHLKSKLLLVSLSTFILACGEPYRPLEFESPIDYYPEVETNNSDIELDKSPMAKLSNGYTRLLLAIESQDKSAIFNMLQTMEVTTYDRDDLSKQLNKSFIRKKHDDNELFNQNVPSYRHTPLSLAAATGQISVMEELIARGADIEEGGGRALKMAVLFEEEKSIITLVQKYDASTERNSIRPAIAEIALNGHGRKMYFEDSKYDAAAGSLKTLLLNLNYRLSQPVLYQIRRNTRPRTLQMTLAEAIIAENLFVLFKTLMQQSRYRAQMRGQLKSKTCNKTLSIKRTNQNREAIRETLSILGC